ncbi:hypothetical protein [Evansella clarkii]|jgi:hypothetical protein|uniref:hypothetical protein n=1 Tax=Evansella clarkii TaxID=79879 RepID=UPI00142F7B6D|nr:hypothetical protein [Evansella clarkii]
MNTHVFILFFNAFLTTLLSSGIVIWILRKQYLPVIRKLEREEEEKQKNIN